MDEWRDIPGYEKTYQVSSGGSVRRLPSVITRVLHGKEIHQSVPARTLKPQGEYPKIQLCINGDAQFHYIHHLVAEVFIGPRPEKQQVCHNNGNPKDPSLSNLRYDTPTGNASDRHQHGTHAKGESNPVAKYTEDVIANIKHDLLTIPQFEVAVLWDVPKSTIRGIKQGVNWAHVEPCPEEPISVIFIGDDD